MRYKYFLLGLLITGISFSSTAQKVKRKGTEPTQVIARGHAAAYSIDQLSGRWQEIKRIPAGSKGPVDFTDSLLMHIENGKAELKDATSMRMTMRGEAAIEAPNSLVVAGDVYTIRSLDSSILVIDDGEFTRSFQKKDQFYFETLGKIKIEQDTVSHPVTIDINNLKGKWLVYSRKAQPGATNEQTPIIRSLEIVSVSDEGIAYGEMVFYISNVSKTVKCQLVTKDGVIKIVTDKDTWNLFAYKADGKEFIFGETGKLVYYSKH